MFGERKSSERVARLLTICHAAKDASGPGNRARSGDEVPMTFGIRFGCVC